MNLSVLQGTTEINGVSDNSNKISIWCGYFLILFTFFYEWQIVAEGLTVSGLIPLDTALVNGQPLVYIITFSMEFSIALFYIKFPTFIRGFKANAICSSILIIIFLVVSICAAMFSLSYRAKGEALFTKLVDDLAGLNQKITAMDQIMSETYVSTLNTHKKLAAQSNRGIDETGIAVCGPICKVHSEKARTLAAQYNSIEIPISGANAEGDINTKWKDLGSRFWILKQKSLQYEKFAVSEGKTPVEDMLQEISKEEQRLYTKYFVSSASTDKTSIVIDEGFRNMKKILKLKFQDLDAITIVSLFMGLLPHLIGLSLSLSINRIKYSNEDLIHEKKFLEAKESLSTGINDLEERIMFGNYAHNLKRKMMTNLSHLWYRCKGDVRER